MMKGIWSTALLVGMSAAASSAQADVRAVEREGFIIHIEQDVAATPDAVFAALARPGDWWDSQHSWSGDARNLSMEARVGGCWCEVLPHGGGVEHGRIVSYDPTGRTIVMASLLGPLRDTAQAGRMIWRVEPLEGGRSRIVWTYRVSHLPSGNPGQDAVIASAVDRVLGQQLARLAAHASVAPIPVP